MADKNDDDLELSKMSIKTSDNPEVEDTVCGIWLFRPKWLQIFASKKVYVIIYGLLGLNQFMLSSYFNGTLTTMEKRFKFSSQTSGIISSTWDLFSVISFMITSYLAGKGHRTRWLAIGSFFVGLSCFVRLMPHIIYGPGEEILQYTVEYGNKENSTFLLSNTSRNEKICDGQPLNDDCDNKEFWNVAAILLCSAHAMLGLGGSMYWTCGAAYLDDNARKNVVPLLLAIVQCIRMLGPMLGYILSAYTLTFFIEPNLTPTITNKDPRWIGAWWMGWTPIGITCIAFSMMMIFFPKALPRAAARKLEQPEVKVEQVSTDFKTSLKRILTNKILIFNSASNSFFMLGLIGYWTFMPKYMETQFRQTAANSNFASGAIGILSSGLGIVTSGVVISKYKPSPRALAMWNFIMEAMEVIGHIAYIFLGCAEKNLHGQWNADKTWNLTMDCNVDCNCGKSMSYNPVCSFDQSTTFYSPCYAGCTKETIIDGIKTYSNCTCIGGLGTAIAGMCPVDCGHDFIIFLVLMGIMRFLSSTGRSGNTIIQFRCVKKEDKSLSLGFSELVMCVIAFMPGPILYGTIVDSTCMVWGGDCGTNGNCWLYDGIRLKYYLNLTGASFLMIGTILDIGVWYHVKDLKIYEDDDNKNTCEQKK
ncbi:solute carrier organic anion transporter family member 5A1-like isoform X2 [Melanaphis sacchari]|uniref:solute carrier organic anion transporter family member 5A1-like isoform X2 n=1 Tax=Melanaphis sacchari TaxID=742174 RepID=UPI000DC14BBA|nr:solute carrier organic anion transporter family member 5A1-like isoform X2 [Melanaphis sacchari]